MSERTTRSVPDDEYLDIDTLVEKFHEGALWYGSDEMNIGWPEELHIGGANLIRLLARLRDTHYDQVQETKRALAQHGVKEDSYTNLADGIHLLVGRRAAR
jgi:hypothetical protein